MPSKSAKVYSPSFFASKRVFHKSFPPFIHRFEGEKGRELTVCVASVWNERIPINHNGKDTKEEKETLVPRLMRSSEKVQVGT